MARNVLHERTYCGKGGDLTLKTFFSSVPPRRKIRSDFLRINKTVFVGKKFGGRKKWMDSRTSNKRITPNVFQKNETSKNVCQSVIWSTDNNLEKAYFIKSNENHFSSNYIFSDSLIRDSLI